MTGQERACVTTKMNDNIVKQIWFYIIVGSYSISHFVLIFLVTLYQIFILTL